MEIKLRKVGLLIQQYWISFWRVLETDNTQRVFQCVNNAIGLVQLIYCKYRIIHRTVNTAACAHDKEDHR